MNDPERILLRAPNWVGDVVLSLPALRDLRRLYPTARLEVLARPWVGELYRAVSEVDAVVESRGVAADAAALRGRFDLGVLLPNSFASALTLWRAGIPERWGYATDARGLLLTRRCRVPASVRGQSQVYYYRAMLEGLGLAVAGPPDASLACPEEWATRGRAPARRRRSLDRRQPRGLLRHGQALAAGAFRGRRRARGAPHRRPGRDRRRGGRAAARRSDRSPARRTLARAVR